MWQLSDKAVVESWSVTSTTTGIATRAEERFDRDIELCYRSQYRAKLRNDTEIMFSYLEVKILDSRILLMLNIW